MLSFPLRIILFFIIIESKYQDYDLNLYCFQTALNYKYVFKYESLTFLNFSIIFILLLPTKVLPKIAPFNAGADAFYPGDYCTLQCSIIHGDRSLFCLTTHTCAVKKMARACVCLCVYLQRGRGKAKKYNGCYNYFYGLRFFCVFFLQFLK